MEGEKHGKAKQGQQGGERPSALWAASPRNNQRASLWAKCLSRKEEGTSEGKQRHDEITQKVREAGHKTECEIISSF